MKKLFLLLIFAALTSRAATYQVALPGGGTLVINGLPYLNPQITNSASVVWTTNADGLLTLAATAVGTNASIVFVEGSAVSSPNFGVSTEIDPAVVTTNVTFSIVNSSITTNKIDPTFYSLLMQAGAGDVTQAGNNTFTGTNIFGNQTTISNLAITTANVGSMTLSTPIGVTAVGTNAADARGALGVAYDIDVQAYRLGLLQAALALTADGHMVYHNGTLVTNLASTAAGRALLTAASASAQWNNYLLSVASTNGGYDASSWNGVTDRLVTLDQFRDVITALPGGSNAITSVTAPLSLTNGVLSIDTSGLGGGGGGGVTWIVNEPLGSWYGRDTTTNWPLLSVTISSNNLPTVAGQYLFGHVSGIISNLSGTSATVYYNADVNGVRVFRDSYGVAGTVASRGRPFIGEFYLVYETASTASLVQIGTHVSATNPDIGGSGDIANNAVAFQIIATNIAVNWSSNITLALGFECDTSTSTNAALGLRKVSASLLKYSAATGGSITADGTAVTNIVSSASITNTVAGGQTTLSVIGSGVTGINADNIASGTLASNRLPAAIALTTLSAGTLTATSVAGDGSGLTNLNGSNISSGTVAAARIDSAIARLASPAITGTPTVNGTNLMAAIASAGGSGAAKSKSSFYAETEFLMSSAVAMTYASLPWAGTAVASGTSVPAVGDSEDAGAVTPTSSTSANSGYHYLTHATAFALGAEWNSYIRWTPLTTNAGTFSRIGWQDSTTVSLPTDGFLLIRSNNIVSGYTFVASAVNATTTSYSIETNTTYAVALSVQNATNAQFTLYNSDGTTALWTETLTNAVPTGTTGHGVFSYSTNTTAIALDTFRFMNVSKSSVAR